MHDLDASQEMKNSKPSKTVKTKFTLKEIIEIQKDSIKYYQDRFDYAERVLYKHGIEIDWRDVNLEE